MQKPTTIFLVGIASAGLLWTAGALNTLRLTRHEAVLEIQCKESTKPPDKVGFVPDCDWKTLAGNSASSIGIDPDVAAAFTPVGIQADIVKAHQAVAASEAWPIPAALALLGIGATPWLWYFLLRRIAELGSAIGGKPPI
jgi:hypothetical protein